MHRFRLILFALCMVAVVGADVAPVASQSSDDEIADWLQAHVIPLNTVEFTGNYTDLMPLQDLIGDARIVALGDATHGTHEFFTIKHRMIEFLVREMGFTILALEFNWPETEQINHYVHTGEGNPAELLPGLSYTQEILDLIEWIRSYNADPGNNPKVSFVGFDAVRIELAVANVLDYLREVAPEEVEQVSTRYACLDEFRLLNPDAASLLEYSQRPLSETQQCGDNVRAVYDDLVENVSSYTALSSTRAYDFAVHNALTVVQAEEFFAGRYTSGPNPRDRYMAQNISWLLEQGGPDTKIMVWAHNAHIMQGGRSNMGAHLHREYEDDYLVFGFSFDHGSFYAREMTVVDDKPRVGEFATFEFELAPVEAFAAYFRLADTPAFILDVRDLDYGESGAKWLRNPHVLRGVGQTFAPAYPEQFFSSVTLTIAFDFVVFVEETTPSQLLPPYSAN